MKSREVLIAAAPFHLLTGLYGCSIVPKEYAHGLSKGLHRSHLQGAINDAKGVDVRIAADPAQKQENLSPGAWGKS